MHLNMCKTRLPPSAPGQGEIARGPALASRGCFARKHPQPGCSPLSGSSATHVRLHAKQLHAGLMLLARLFREVLSSTPLEIAQGQLAAALQLLQISGFHRLWPQSLRLQSPPPHLHQHALAAQQWFRSQPASSVSLGPASALQAALGLLQVAARPYPLALPHFHGSVPAALPPLYDHNHRWLLLQAAILMRLTQKISPMHVAMYRFRWSSQRKCLETASLCRMLSSSVSGDSLLGVEKQLHVCS